MLWRMASPHLFLSQNSTARQQLGWAIWGHYEAFRLASAALGFLAAWRFADLAWLWLVCAILTGLVALALVAGATLSRVQPPGEPTAAAAPRSGERSRIMALIWRLQPGGVLLFAT
jgi:hypothetical protein